jgi:hypothetical protein
MSLLRSIIEIFPSVREIGGEPLPQAAYAEIAGSLLYQWTTARI